MDVGPETNSLRSLICVSHLQIVHKPFDTSLWAWNVTLDSSAAKLLYDNKEPAMGAQHGGRRTWRWKEHCVWGRRQIQSCVVQGKSMCAFGILKSRAHTLGTHTATLFILETHRDKLFTLILAPYPVSSWSNQLMDLATISSWQEPPLVGMTFFLIHPYLTSPPLNSQDEPYLPDLSALLWCSTISGSTNN